MLEAGEMALDPKLRKSLLLTISLIALPIITVANLFRALAKMNKPLLKQLAILLGLQVCLMWLPLLALFWTVD